MTDRCEKNLKALAHEIWAAAQLVPGEGIVDGVARVEALLRKAPHPAVTHCDNCGCDWLDNGLNPIGCPYCKQSGYERATAAQQPAAVDVDDDGRDAPAQATQAVPQGWPRATKGQRDLGWTLEYRFLERVTDLAAPRTNYSTSMEATEQVLIAALEVLAAQQQGGAE